MTESTCCHNKALCWWHWLPPHRVKEQRENVVHKLQHFWHVEQFQCAHSGNGTHCLADHSLLRILEALHVWGPVGANRLRCKDR